MAGIFFTPGQRFILFSGKGGVGKTTCAAAAALKAAGMGKKTLLFSTDPAHSLGDSLDIRLGQEIQAVAPNLWVWEINAQTQMERLKQQYGAEFVKLLTVATYLDQYDIEDSLELAVPGIDELMGLKAVMDLIDNHEFDLLVWDTAPTGHTLRLLDLPQIFDEWIKLLARLRWKYKSFVFALSGSNSDDLNDDILFVLKKTVARVNKLLRNPGASKFVAVTLLESMAISETNRLTNTLHSRGIPVRNLLLNRVMPQVEGCSFCAGIRQAQQLVRKQVHTEFAGWDIREVPLQPGGVKGIEQLSLVSSAIFGG